MELLKWELRKIWRPGILAAILLLGRCTTGCSHSSISSTFATVPSRSTVRSGLRLGGAVWPHPGTEERAELDEQMAGEITAFDTQITAIPEAARSGADGL